MWVLFVTIGAIWTGYGHRLQGFLDSEYLAVERLTMCAYPLVVGSHDFATCPASTIFAGWRQSVLPVHLLGLDALLGSVGPVAGDVKLQDDGVVHDPVNRRGGGHGVGEDALPLGEDQV